MSQTPSPLSTNQQFYGAQAANNLGNRYMQELETARQELLSKGIVAETPVFITAIAKRNFSGSPAKAGQTCEVTGHYASVRLADWTHRLATDEEILKYKQEQRARELWCADEEAKKPENLGKALINKLNITAQAIPAAASTGHTTKTRSEA
jgi:hypothetical protein